MQADSGSGGDVQDIRALRERLDTLERENARLLEHERARLQETQALAGIRRLLSERPPFPASTICSTSDNTKIFPDSSAA